MRDHETLIDALGRDLKPVRRPLPPLLRALAWGAAALACGWVATAFLRGPLPDWSVDDGRGLVQLILALALGVAALAAAFSSTVPGSRSKWTPVLVVGATAWLAAGFANVIGSGVPVGAWGDGSFCFPFLLTASAPMAALTVVALRRTGSLTPRRTLTAAGLGVGAFAAALLALCHPFALELVDFLMHLAAVAVAMLATVVLGGRWVDWPAR